VPFLSREVEGVLGVIALIIMGLVMLAKRRPDIAWLQPFRGRELSPAQQERNRKRANRYAGVELILLGIIVPMGYVALTVMMFSSFETVPTVLVALGSALCIGLGVTAIVKG